MDELTMIELGLRVTLERLAETTRPAHKDAAYYALLLERAGADLYKGVCVGAH